MLLSLSKKFLFIANLKTASTAIERVLAPHCELRLTSSPFGKHQSFVEFAERFRWLLSVTAIEDLFIFGVIRDPVDFVLDAGERNWVLQRTGAVVGVNVGEKIGRASCRERVYACV